MTEEETTTRSKDGVSSHGNVPRKPYVRVITDKRREQNRKAQKAYRERLRKKLEDLEEQASAGGGGATTGTTGAGATSSCATTGPNRADGFSRSSADSNANRGATGYSRASGNTNSNGSANPPRPSRNGPVADQSTLSSESGSHPPRVINLADAFVAAGDLPFSAGPLPGPSLQLGADILTPPDSDRGPQTVDNDNYGERVEDEYGYEGLDPILAEQIRGCNDYGDLDLKHIWAMPSRPRTKKDRQYERLVALMALTPPSSQGSLSRYTTPGSSLSISRSPTSAVLPDPYVNHIRLVGEINIEASLAVALGVGITRSQYINDQPSHFPSCYVQFDRPHDKSVVRSVNYSHNGFSMVVTQETAEHMQQIAPALRPTPNQLLSPHPAYLDCIVFPYFREHAVRASVEGILDHGELFMDIMNGGLVCWGGRSGVTNVLGRTSREGDGKRGMRESVAWDTRSWEAKRWFLDKWAWLVGTEDDEDRRGDVYGVWRGSRWWWRMRGEGEGDDEDTEGGRVVEVDGV